VLRLEEVTVGAAHEGVHLVVGEVVAVFGSLGRIAGHGSLHAVATHSPRKEALFMSNLILVHVFCEVTIVSLRDHVLVFHETSEVLGLVVLTLR